MGVKLSDVIGAGRQEKTEQVQDSIMYDRDEKDFRREPIIKKRLYMGRTSDEAPSCMEGPYWGKVLDETPS